MKLRDYTIEELAKMVIGDNGHFPYRSSKFITGFFTRCNLGYRHDGTTRAYWTKEVLKELNEQPVADPELPSAEIIRILVKLFDEDDFDRNNKNRLEALNELLGRDSLAVHIDDAGKLFVRNTGTGSTSANQRQLSSPLTKEERQAKEKIAEFLDKATEDEFTEKLQVPFFQRLGFRRVSPGGHKEKLLEFGKDLWMKYHLPTGHWIYFCAQIKKGKIDASGTGGAGNVTEILNQVRMAMDNPIFDPEINSKVLVDHVYIIAGGDITRPARQWLSEHLDKEQRRRIIFMDRAEFLDQAARILKDIQSEDKQPDLSTSLLDNHKFRF